MTRQQKQHVFMQKRFSRFFRLTLSKDHEISIISYYCKLKTSRRMDQMVLLVFILVRILVRESAGYLSACHFQKYMIY